jgi:hypothetical protein
LWWTNRADELDVITQALCPMWSHAGEANQESVLGYSQQDPEQEKEEVNV